MRRALETRLPGSGSAPGPVAGAGLDRLAGRSRAPLSLLSRHSSGAGIVVPRATLRIPRRAQYAPGPARSKLTGRTPRPGAGSELRVREPELSWAPELRAH